MTEFAGNLCVLASGRCPDLRRKDVWIGKWGWASELYCGLMKCRVAMVEKCPRKDSGAVKKQRRLKMEVRQGELF